MNLSERLKQLKKDQTQVRVHYGKTGRIEGVVTDYSTGLNARVLVQTKLGEYSIAIGDVLKIVPVSG